MNIFRIVIVIILFNSGLLYSQESLNQNPATSDSFKIKLKLNGTVLPSNELQAPKLILPFMINKNVMFLEHNMFFYSGFSQTYNGFTQQKEFDFAKNNISNFLLLKITTFQNTILDD